MGLPCAVAAVNIALWSDNLECLKLLLERPAVDENSSAQFTAWNKFDVDVAARKGFAECIALAVEHGCPWYREVRGSTPEIACRMDSVPFYPVQAIYHLHLCFLPRL